MTAVICSTAAWRTADGPRPMIPVMPGMARASGFGFDGLRAGDRGLRLRGGVAIFAAVPLHAPLAELRDPALRQAFLQAAMQLQGQRQPALERERHVIARDLDAIKG